MRAALPFLLALVGLFASLTGPAQAAGQQTEPTRPSFAEFLAAVRSDAIARGVRETVVDEALSTVSEPLPVVIERDRTQAETVLALEKYLARRLTPKTIRTGREMLARHHDLLAKVSDRYGVPAPILVAIWGVESGYGRFSGIRPTIGALATLAWDARRSAFFRGELLDALEILNRADIDLATMKGSWAGAMGQTQFMPSSYLKFAEDFDGDGRRDIWSTPADVFASIANYLKGHGWTAGETWGREVTVSLEAARRIDSELPRRDGSCQATRDMSVPLALSDWRSRGVRATGGRPLPSSQMNASMVAGTTRRFLVYRNYDALLDYNCANAYALGVALLADRISSGTPAPAVARPKGRALRPKK